VFLHLCGNNTANYSDQHAKRFSARRILTQLFIMPWVKNRSMQMQRFSALMVAVYPPEGLEEPTHFEFLSNTFIAKQILKSLSSRLILLCANSATMLIRYSIFCLDK
jgi:hypothetical protein